VAEKAITAPSSAMDRDLYFIRDVGMGGRSLAGRVVSV
jgi:hypothetical protein